jgi:hypothetical protein
LRCPSNGQPSLLCCVDGELGSGPVRPTPGPFLASRKSSDALAGSLTCSDQPSAPRIPRLVLLEPETGSVRKHTRRHRGPLHGRGIHPKVKPSTKPAINARAREPIDTQNIARGPVPCRSSEVVSLGDGSCRVRDASDMCLARRLFALTTSAPSSRLNFRFC